MTEIKVGDKVRIIDVPKSFSLKGVGVGSVGEVISLRDNDTSAAVYFEGLSTLVAFTDRDEYLKTIERGWGAVFLVEKVEDGDNEVEEQVFKVGDKAVVVKIHSNVDLEGVNIGAVAEVVDVHSTGKQLLMRFECGSKWWAHFDIKEYEEFSRTVHSNTILVKKVEDALPCDGVNLKKVSVESEETPTDVEDDAHSEESELRVEGLPEILPYWGDFKKLGKVGDASAEAVAQGYKTIVEKGDLTIYTNLPTKIVGDIIVVGEKNEL